MQQSPIRFRYPALKQLIQEASQALAQLDAQRLEELALCCEALNRDLAFAARLDRAELAQQAREAREDLGVFARVLEATGANVAVMQRIRELRAGGQLEYRAGSAILRLPPRSGYGDA